MSAPLISSGGHRIGSLCIADYVARPFTSEDVRLLNNFAELAIRILEEHLDLSARVAAGKDADLAMSLRR